MIYKWIDSLNKNIKNFFTGYFNLLLTMLVLLFIFRPYDRGGFYNGFWQLCFFITLLSAIFNCNHPNWIKILALCFGLPAVIFHWLELIKSPSPFIIICLIFTIIFIAICTLSILVRVVIRAKVTMETLKGVICAYFLIAFLFAMSYFLVEILHPGSFYISYQGDVQYSYTHYLSEMIYFSFITLLTIGYGDINATADVGQTLSVLEGIIGQFYIAILVARLVAVYSLLENKGILEKIKKEEKELGKMKSEKG